MDRLRARLRIEYPAFARWSEFPQTARLFAVTLNHTAYRKYLFAKDAVLPNAYNSDAVEFGLFNEFSAAGL